MRRHLIIFLVVLLVASTALIGCSGGSGPSDNGTNGANGYNDDNTNTGDTGDKGSNSGEVIDSVDDPKLLAEGWITDIASFVALFKGAKWDMGDGLVLEYVYEGSETVNGIATEKVSACSKGDNDECGWTIWIDAEGNIIKAESKDLMVDESMYGLLKIMTVPFLATFVADDNLVSGLIDTLSGKTVPGWTVIQRERARETFGGKSIYVYSIQLEHPAWGKGPTSFSFGDFGSFKMLLSHEKFSSYDLLSIDFR